MIFQDEGNINCYQCVMFVNSGFTGVFSSQGIWSTQAFQGMTICTTFFSMHLWWLWVYIEITVDRKPQFQWCIAKRRTRMFYASAFHLEGKRGGRICQGHAAFTGSKILGFQVPVKLNITALFLQHLFGFCNSFQVWLLEMFMCF